MAEVNPPSFLQNAGNVHTAQVTRQLLNHLSYGTLSLNALRARGGVHHAQGAGLAVQQASSPNMTVDVGSGNAIIPGTEDSKQGCYGVQNDATKNVAISASDPSLPRIDLIVFKVQDSFYSGASNTSSIVAVTGTPAGSPVAPAAPANSLILAQIAVGAGVTSIVNANITDRRRFLAAAGGILIAGSGSRPSFTEVTQSGAFLFETDTQLVRSWDGPSSAWIQRSPYMQQVTLSGTTASVTFSNIPSSMRRVIVNWSVRGTAAAANAVLHMRINGDTTSTHYHYSSCQTQNTSQTNSVDTNGTDRITVGIISAASVASTNYGDGEVVLYNWNAQHNWLGCTFHSMVWSDSAANSGQFWGGGKFVQNGPYTSITFFPDTGSFAANSHFKLEAWE